MQNHTEQNSPMFTPKAKKIGLGVCAGLLITSLSAGVLAAHHERGKGGHERGPVVLSEVEQRVEERFNTADVNSDGVLSAAELATVEPRKRKMKRKHKRKNRGAGPDDAAVFQALDADGSGELSQTEFSKENRRSVRKQMRNEHRFAKLDSDNSGSIERAEFGTRIERLRAADADGDGTVTRDEMRTARSAHRAARQSALQNDNS